MEEDIYASRYGRIVIHSCAKPRHELEALVKCVPELLGLFS
jgi:hypothetical protein